MKPVWFQVSLQRELPAGRRAEQVKWLRQPKVGDQDGDMTVALVYSGLGCGECPGCGKRLSHPDSRAHVVMAGRCLG